MTYAEIASTVLRDIAVAGLVVSLAVLFVLTVCMTCWGMLRKWFRLDGIQQVLSAVFVVGLVMYGATKSSFRYDGGIKAGATASVSSNDTVTIYWQRDTTGGIYVPESATVYIDYRLNTDTNGNWTALAQTNVGAWSWTGTVPNATNYDYQVWAYYIPPAPVHTNGVWVYKTLKDRGNRHAIPIRARIEIDGKAIATPKEKRKDEQE